MSVVRWDKERSMPSKLQELQSRLTAKQNILQSIYSQSKKSDGDWDFTKADEFSHLVEGRDKLEAQAACVDTLKEYEEECKSLFDQVKTIQDMNSREESLNRQVEERRKIVDRHVHPENMAAHSQQPLMKTLGQLIREYWPEEGERRRGGLIIDREFKNWSLDMLRPEMKATFERTAGWAPESTRIPRIVEFALSDLVVTDLLPVGNTTQALVKWMQETTFTNTAAEKAEGVASTEATLALTEQSATIQKIPVHLNVTEEQLDDVDQVSGYVDARMRTMVQRRLETQILAGDGIAPNIMGFLNAGVASQAKGGDDVPDAIYKAMDKVRTPGEGNPTAVIIHPTNWQPVRLMKTALGYVWGHPSEVGPTRIFGVPVVVTSNITLGTALTGDFVGYSQLWMRQGVEVQVGYIASNFIAGIQTVRATLRAALAIYRLTAFCTVTGL
jgi:HK97 family phage major capsid protein